tara:strand:+ start:221 stop:394 length:174 start_codon:yes stop_codon:yes gene_type:complete
VISAGDVQATAWIWFCVQCTTRFDDPPEESEILAVLEEFSGVPKAVHFTGEVFCELG